MGIFTIALTFVIGRLLGIMCVKLSIKIAHLQCNYSYHLLSVTIYFAEMQMMPFQQCKLLLLWFPSLKRWLFKHSHTNCFIFSMIVTMQDVSQLEFELL